MDSRKMTKEEKSNLETKLYEDAERRKRDNAAKKLEFQKKDDTPKEEKFINQKRDKYVASRFNREFDEALQEFDLDKNAAMSLQ